MSNLNNQPSLLLGLAATGCSKTECHFIPHFSKTTLPKKPAAMGPIYVPLCKETHVLCSLLMETVH